MQSIVHIVQEVDASKVFGKLCVTLRNEKDSILLSLVNTVTKSTIENGQFVLQVSNAVEYQQLSKPNHLTHIQSIVGMPVVVQERKKSELISNAEYLKQKIEGIIID